MDKIKLLKQYNPLVQAASRTGVWPIYSLRSKDNLISNEDLEELKKLGLAFDFIDISHDDAVEKCFSFYRALFKRNVTDCFLAGLSTNQPQLRASLSAYAIMQTYPNHKYVGSPINADFCEICCCYEKESELDLTFFNSCRYVCGSLVQKSPYSMMFYLEQQLKLEVITPNKLDFDIFNEVLRVCVDSCDEMTPSKLVKEIRKIKGFNFNVEQTRSFLETLGYCSILASEKHKGYLINFTNLGLHPRKTHSSDWAYPMDFWKGSNGVNKKALEFWFGCYPEINI